MFSFLGFYGSQTEHTHKTNEPTFILVLEFIYPHLPFICFTYMNPYIDVFDGSLTLLFVIEEVYLGVLGIG